MGNISDEQVCKTLAQASTDLDELQARRVHAYAVGQFDGYRLPLSDSLRLEETIRDLAHIVRTKRDEAIIGEPHG
jgi:hypothetical protein